MDNMERTAKSNERKVYSHEMLSNARHHGSSGDISIDRNEDSSSYSENETHELKPNKSPPIQSQTTSRTVVERSTKPKSELLENVKLNSNQSRWLPNWLSIIIILGACLLAFVCYNNNNHQLILNNINRTASVETFTKELDSMKAKFSTQTFKTWKTISSVVKSTFLRSPPRSPGVISIMAASNAGEIANCLGRRLAELVRQTYNDSDYVILRGDNFANVEASVAKLEMDNIIKSGLEGGRHVVLVQNFHAIPPTSSLIFHGLCDNDNAPFKEAVYILTLQMIDDERQKAEPEITARWKNVVDKDILSSLESRIGNSIVVIDAETNASLDQFC